MFLCLYNSFQENFGRSVVFFQELLKSFPFVSQTQKGLTLFKVDLCSISEMKRVTFQSACRLRLLKHKLPKPLEGFPDDVCLLPAGHISLLSCRPLNAGGVNDILTENEHGLFCILIARQQIKHSVAALHSEPHNLSLLIYHCCTHIRPSHASHILFHRNSFCGAAHAVPVTAYPASLVEIKSGDTPEISLRFHVTKEVTDPIQGHYVNVAEAPRG